MTTPSTDPKVLGELIKEIKSEIHTAEVQGLDKFHSIKLKKAALPTLLALQAALSAPVARGWWCAVCPRGHHWAEQDFEPEYCDYHPAMKKEKDELNAQRRAAGEREFEHPKGGYCEKCVIQPVLIIATEGK